MRYDPVAQIIRTPIAAQPVGPKSHDGRHHARPRRTMISAGEIERTLAMVQLALANCNQEQAEAAIARVFEDPGAVEITVESPITDLGLDVRTVNGLETAGLITVGQLVEKSRDELLDLPNFGWRTANQIESSLANHGLRLRAN